MAYRKSVITFLDILGFRQVVETRGADEITAMLNAVGETAATAGSPDDVTAVLSFSDSIIRMRHTKKGAAFDDLLHEVKALAQAQWNLMELGILVRGGVTIGLVEASPGRAFGPGFVRAYELESSLAGSPRIIIDPAVVQELRNSVRSASTTAARREMIEALKSHVRLGDDGLWFIDYIASTGKGTNPAAAIASLQRFRNMTIEKTNLLSEKSLVLAKYLWLIRYHNKSVRRLFPAEKSLLIRSSDVPAADELLKPRLKAAYNSAASSTG